jgi:hypothetical protein
MTGLPKKAKDRYPLNADGDFYVENGMCIICCAPEHAAPALMGFFSDPDGSNRESHCYFKQQPRTEAETRDAIDAIRASCCGALRYGGSDRRIIDALIQAGNGAACDNAPEDTK